MAAKVRPVGVLVPPLPAGRAGAARPHASAGRSAGTGTGHRAGGRGAAGPGRADTAASGTSGFPAVPLAIGAALVALLALGFGLVIRHR
jgi:hypothetical protein